MKTYKEFVKAGKIIVKALDTLKELESCYQSKLAKYATKVCTIRHGGISTDIYTIKDYAEEIGLHYKTLQNWISTYRNVIEKLGIEEPTVEEWRKASKVNNILKMDRTTQNKKNGKKGTRAAYKSQIPKERIKHLFDGVEEKPFVGECHAITEQAIFTKGVMTRHAGTLSNINEVKMQRVESSVIHTRDLLEKRDLGIVDDDRLIYLMETLDEASEIINRYLTNKKNKAV